MLIDDALAKIEPYNQHWAKRIRPVAPTAKRFIFPDEASTFLGKFIRNCGDLILQNRQFAIPPFPRTYLELNLKAMTQALGRTTTNDDLPIYNDDSADDRVGYLIEGNDIWTFAGSSKHAGIGMFHYRLNAIGPRENLLAFGGGREQWSRLGLFLGSTLHDIPDEHTRDHVLATTWFEAVSPRVYQSQELFSASNGDIRNVWAMLLLLNQPKHVHFDQQPARAVLRKGKRVAYAAHSIVEINIGKMIDIRKSIHFTDRASPRRHAVRGHFAHFNIDRRCEHAWPLLPDVDGRWPCAKCGGWRTWRAAFERGDATKGYVTKEYAAKVGEPF